MVVLEAKFVTTDQLTDEFTIDLGVFVEIVVTLENLLVSDYSKIKMIKMDEELFMDGSD